MKIKIKFPTTISPGSPGLTAKKKNGLARRVLSSVSPHLKLERGKLKINYSQGEKYEYEKNNQANICALRLRIAYFANEMLFIKQYVIWADDKEYILPMREMTRQQDVQKLDIPDVYCDHEGGGICEYYDVVLLPQEIEILRRISTSKSAKMKYVGTKGNQKVNIHKEEIIDN